MRETRWIEYSEEFVMCDYCDKQEDIPINQTDLPDGWVSQFIENDYTGLPVGVTGAFPRTSELTFCSEEHRAAYIVAKPSRKFIGWGSI